MIDTYVLPFAKRSYVVNLYDSISRKMVLRQLGEFEFIVDLIIANIPYVHGLSNVHHRTSKMDNSNEHHRAIFKRTIMENSGHGILI